MEKQPAVGMTLYHDSQAELSSRRACETDWFYALLLGPCICTIHHYCFPFHGYIGTDASNEVYYIIITVAPVLDPALFFTYPEESYPEVATDRTKEENTTLPPLYFDFSPG